MKKKLLAVGVAATLGMMSGVASAQVQLDAGGVGAINLIPYYSVQGGNATLISIVNTDTLNGKAVKVRFRGAEWSDDVFDFQIFMSPADVWTGAVSLSSGAVKMTTTDSSCTLPASVNQNFVTIRLDPASATTGALEGYVEIITMADIPEDLIEGVGEDFDNDGVANEGPVTSALWTNIKHPADAAPPCKADGSLLAGLDEDNALVAAATVAQQNWMDDPTNSLTTSVTVINVPSSKAFTTNATAVSVTNGVKQYFRQANEAIGYSLDQSSDRIFAAAGSDLGTRGTSLPMFQFDLPDLSTPLDTTYDVGSGADATLMRDALTLLLSKSSAITEYETSDSILGATDVVLSQPTRRYHYDYIATESGDTPDRNINGGAWDVYGEDGTVYDALDGASNRVPVGAPGFWDREENTLVTSDDIVISPTPPGVTLEFSLKGEVSVVSINNGGIPSGALGAQLTADDYTATGTAGVFANGWAVLSTIAEACTATNQAASNCDGLGYTDQYSFSETAVVGDRVAGGGGGALPVIGYTAQNVFNAAVGSAGTNYGLTYPLRYRP